MTVFQTYMPVTDSDWLDHREKKPDRSKEPGQIYQGQRHTRKSNPVFGAAPASFIDELGYRYVSIGSHFKSRDRAAWRKLATFLALHGFAGEEVQVVDHRGKLAVREIRNYARFNDEGALVWDDSAEDELPFDLSPVQVKEVFERSGRIFPPKHKPSMKCHECGQPHGKSPQARYCKQCKPKVRARQRREYKARKRKAMKDEQAKLQSSDTGSDSAVLLPSGG